MSDGDTRPWVASVPTRLGQTAFPEKSKFQRHGSSSKGDAYNSGSLRRFVRRLRRKGDKIVLPDSPLHHEKQKLDYVVRIQPTPSEIDAMDYDPLVMMDCETPTDIEHEQKQLHMPVDGKECPSRTTLIKVLNNFLSRRKASKKMREISEEDGKRILSWMAAHHDADPYLHSAKLEEESTMSTYLRHCSDASTLIAEESHLGSEVERRYAPCGPQYHDFTRQYHDFTRYEMENNFLAELMDTSPRVELPDTSSPALTDTSSPALASSDVSVATPSVWAGSTLGDRSETSSSGMTSQYGSVTSAQKCNSVDSTNTSKVYEHRNKISPSREVLASDENHSTCDGSPAVPKPPPIMVEHELTAENKAVTAPSIVSTDKMLAEESYNLVAVILKRDQVPGSKRPSMFPSDESPQELWRVEAATERVDRRKGKISERDLRLIDTKSCAENTIIEALIFRHKKSAGLSKKQAGKSSTSGTGNGDGKASSEPRPLGPPTKRRRTDERKISFACPYSKKDPMRHRDCYKYTLTRIRDVKQHLTRCHRRPLYCPRCFEIFETEDSRDDHIIACGIASPSTTRPDGITEAQRQQLSKKSTPNSPFEDQWFAIWNILFPGSPPPKSPYVDNDLLQGITHYQDFVTTSGPHILSEFLSQRGAMITWSMPNEERDLAALQQTILEEGLRAVFAQWASNNGIARAASTATSLSSSSAHTGASTPPTSASVNSTNVALPPQGHSTLRYGDPIISNNYAPPEAHTREPNQIFEMHCPAAARSAHPQGQEFVPNTIAQPTLSKVPRHGISQNTLDGPSSRRRTIDRGIDYSMLGQQFSDNFLPDSRAHQGEPSLPSMATEVGQEPPIDVPHSLLNEGPLATFDYEPERAHIPFEDDGDGFMGVSLAGSVAPGLPELDFGTGLGQIDHNMGSWMNTP
ncbi:HET and ankyrin domain protein [Diaporthe amygdali]|uniref:HET and ankyrin domain protein n=1 Tax=Phomopsis amygdali TaxID=1214568 RepID=UPI0022FEA695|nr:HET and ankyrin domain protein [Diaporthe amygdali]KAJ0109776.1 HET and ankyrin domain protein [Diaporthe amygdali]